MPRKTKASAEEKVQIVEAYLWGEMGLKSAAAKIISSHINNGTMDIPP